MQRLLCHTSLLFVLAAQHLSAQPVLLDSLHYYALDSRGEERLSGRAVYTYTDSLGSYRSVYEIYNEYRGRFDSINIQTVVHNEFDRVDHRVTYDFKRGTLDSVQYFYERDTLVREMQWFKSDSGHPGNLALWRRETYGDFDFTGRKTSFTREQPIQGRMQFTREQIDYTYNNLGLLTERNTKRIEGERYVPTERLVQTYDAEGRIQSVTQQRYLGPMEGFHTYGLHQYVYHARRRIQTKFVLDPDSGDFRHHFLTIIDYRTEARRYKDTAIFYVLEDQEMKLIKREQYFYRE
ncbi:MAG: hypothetical protein KDC54_03505 [Lewinella sp.]|nr:hypothetical protein [Lewinella sp.]